MAKIKRTAPNIGKDVHQLELSHIIGGTLNGVLHNNIHLLYDQQFHS